MGIDMPREVLRRGLKSQAKVPRQRGQAIIEMALVMTILVSLTFGIADMGLYAFRYIQAANCAREVARRAVVRDPEPTKVKYCIDEELTVTLDGDPQTQEAGTEITASINTVHDWIVIDQFVPALGPTAPLNVHASMRMEGRKL